MCPHPLNVSCMILFRSLETKVGRTTLNAYSYLNGVYTLNIIFVGTFVILWHSWYEVLMCHVAIFLGLELQFLYMILSTAGKQMFLHWLPIIYFFFFLFLVTAMYFFNFFQFYWNIYI